MKTRDQIHALALQQIRSLSDIEKSLPDHATKTPTKPYVAALCLAESLHYADGDHTACRLILEDRAAAKEFLRQSTSVLEAFGKGNVLTITQCLEGTRPYELLCEIMLKYLRDMERQLPMLFHGT